MDTELDRTLRAHGHRVTRPRRVVWQALQAEHGHRTVEEIAASIEDAGEEVDTASLYRTLSLFEELGLARVTRLGDRDAGRWELAHPDEHFHLVCQVCGDVDHHVGTLVARIREHLEEGHGFATEHVELVVNGRCADCQRAGAS
ncbi:Fur family transcriptional regulator [Egicoccus sp. AB-alg2]|uniref:Fur family transcriptional regulator n=1 Tax=Egicoccus sp. AB-alg2 TaxID=3242693 RepID=UPI00359E3DE8